MKITVKKLKEEIKNQIPNTRKDCYIKIIIDNFTIIKFKDFYKFLNILDNKDTLELTITILNERYSHEYKGKDGKFINSYYSKVFFKKLGSFKCLKVDYGIGQAYFMDLENETEDSYLKDDMFVNIVNLDDKEKEKLF